MNTISFITANYVAREIGYNMTEGWAQGDTATQNAFKPVASFEKKFDEMLQDIKALGFSAIDLWGAHLHASWATKEHVATAKDLLTKHNIKVMSFAAWIGSVEHLMTNCKLANAMGVPVIGGGAPALAENRKEMIAILKDHGVKLGIENHPEKSPAEILAQIGDGGDGHIGTACDTGWWGTQGYDAAKAIRELKGHLFAIHLKDVKAAGAHETCRYGEGVVNIQESVKALKEVGFTGPLGIEHEPEHHDPTEDVRESLRMLQGWLK
ncbi:MAG: sugar phosphate isomerase/epimerase family protein [Trueperaceae bacterium]